MSTKNFKSTKIYVLTALFAALIFLVTAYILHIPTPATGGYIHLGDAFLYLAASILPTPLAIVAGGIGEAFSDFMTGSAVYVIPTLIIKSLMVLCFTSAKDKIISKRNMAATAAAGVICVSGYYITQVILYSSFVTPLVEIPANLVQTGSSAVIYLLLGNAFDRLNVKKQIAIFNN